MKKMLTLSKLVKIQKLRDNQHFNKSTLDNSPPLLLSLKLLLRPQGQTIDVKCKNRNKSSILIFVQPYIELFRELVISNMHNQFGKDT